MRSRCCAPKTSSEKPFISLSIHAHADFFGRRLRRGAPLVVPLRLFHAGNDVAVFLSFPSLGSAELPVGPAPCCLPKGCTPNVEPHWGWDCCCSQVVLSIRGMTMMVAVQLQCNGQSRQLRDGMDIPAHACLHVPGEQLRVLGGVCTPRDKRYPCPLNLPRSLKPLRSSAARESLSINTPRSVWHLLP